MSGAGVGKVNRSEVGAWVLKGNPSKTWDYFGALEASRDRPGQRISRGWTLGTTYRTGLVEKQDLFVLWITGPRKPGIYEIGTIVAPAGQPTTLDEEFLIDEQRRNQKVPWVKTKSVLLTAPIPRPMLKADPDLIGSEQFAAPQIANPTYLTPEETRALAAYITRRDLELGGWARYAAGRSED